MEEIKVVNNIEKQRFEVALNDDLAILEYRYYEGTMALMHTLVPESFRGMGIAGKLAHAALEFVKANHQKVLVYCPFVAKYLESHPEYNDLVTNRISIKG